jgi:4-hydroxy-3-methylbut-2-enyl diphosphate reductase
VAVEAVTPRGFCHGVVDAITLARRAAADPATPRPIVVLGMLVHNHHVTEDLERLGITTLDGPNRLELLEQVPDGATVVFTAHGVSPAVRARAAQRGLHVIDATCSEVVRTHQVIRDYAVRGYFIVYVGTPNHPEPDGAIGHAPPDRTAMVTTPEDVPTIPFPPDGPVVVVTQTTLSQWDTARVIAAVRDRYPGALVFNEICSATQLRQQAVVEASRRVDAVIVVGDRRSNNTRRLVQVAREQGGVAAFRVDSADDLAMLDLSPYRRIAVTAGSSTPSTVTRAVIARLSALGKTVAPSPS